jgi:hypothetical protein
MARQAFKAELAQHVAQQPESKQAFHKWMRILEMASLTIIAGAFAVAMYVSINWATVPQMAIPTAWLAFPVSVVPLMTLIGLHAIALRAFLPVVLPGETPHFVTGSKAVWSGLGLIVVGLAAAAFWGSFAWAIWSNQLEWILSFTRILGIAMGVLIPVKVILSLAQKLFRFR